MTVNHSSSLLILDTACIDLSLKNCTYKGVHSNTIIVIYTLVLHKIPYRLQNLCKTQLSLLPPPSILSVLL